MAACIHPRQSPTSACRPLRRTAANVPPIFAFGSGKCDDRRTISPFPERVLRRQHRERPRSELGGHRRAITTKSVAAAAAVLVRLLVLFGRRSQARERKVKLNGHTTCCSLCTGSSKKVPPKFSDTCSVRADGLCIGCPGCPELVGRRKVGNSHMKELFSSTL